MAAGWRRADRLIVLAALAAGILIRLWLLPMPGLEGDLDQFVGWVHHIATQGLGSLYGDIETGRVSFGPVMAYVWAALATIQPVFATVTDSSDPAIRVLMKLPATIADFGIAALVVYALRERPRWAAIGFAAVMLHPVVFYVSAWWGQSDSIFVLTGLGALVAALNGRNGLAAALLAVSLMTKPQAIPFIIPFAAWFWATGGLREVARTAVIGLGVIAVLWIPFLADGGPIGYLDNVRYYSSGAFGILSLRAWNPWWLLQEAAAGGDFIRDDVAFLGPFTLRHIGYVVTAFFAAAIGLAIIRDPRPERLILGLAASVLTFFTFMTQMHERYAYAAVILLLLVLYDRRAYVLWLALGAVLTLNLLSAAPANALVQRILPHSGPVSIVGSIVLTACTIVALWLVLRRSSGGPSRTA
jgi:Gpi18-like mannosyltransferase